MLPVLWSFRRCPYAIRARLALASAGIEVDHREILLRDKPAEFLAVSPEATVPVLDTDSATYIHSLDIMYWALRQHDPEGWLKCPAGAADLVELNDTEFKTVLDRYKYHTRHDDVDPATERQLAEPYLLQLNTLLATQGWLFGTKPSNADFAILPFVRQFAHCDLAWFLSRPWPGVAGWLENFKSSERFQRVMVKHPVWQPAEQQA